MVLGKKAKRRWNSQMLSSRANAIPLGNNGGSLLSGTKYVCFLPSLPNSYGIVNCIVRKVHDYRKILNSRWLNSSQYGCSQSCFDTYLQPQRLSQDARRSPRVFPDPPMNFHPNHPNKESMISSPPELANSRQVVKPEQQ